MKKFSIGLLSNIRGTINNFIKENMRLEKAIKNYVENE
jgi:hypothetical protein